MPEGDTIARTATSMNRWLAGRKLTAASTHNTPVVIDKLIGETVTDVEAHGKHLVIKFAGGLALRTHMRMTGSWHLYEAGARWQKPKWQAKVVLEAGDRLAVCFNVPVIELTTAASLADDGPMALLGPDVLADPLDLTEIQRRRHTRPPERTVGELLLDQQIVAGIGNIYRCESLFLQKVDPWVSNRDLSDATWDGLVVAAAELMKPSAQRAERTRRDGRWVYRRNAQPCRKCGTTIQRKLLGRNQPRAAYWCPICQPPPPN